MNVEVIQALRDSLIGDTTTLQKTNSKLADISKNEGYCMCLMQIINEPTFDIPLKQAALIQLKNNIKARWKTKTQKIQITANQKNHIRNALVRALIQCAKNHLLIKLYRQVLTTVVSYQFQTWLPVTEILQHLHKGENIAPVLHCILAICTNFQFSVADKQRNLYYQFIKQILPVVFQVVKNNLGDSEIVYLSLKVLWKSVHYQITNQIKLLTNTWMQLLLLTIQAHNDTIQKHLQQFQVKNTPQFYYYHSKKWATRTLMRFVHKHAKAYQFGKVNQQNLQYANFWYDNYGTKFCEVIVKHLQLPIPTIKKIRYFQLKIIQGIVSDRPNLISSIAQHFQYDILLKYMRLTQQDQNLAKDDVVQYLRSEDDFSSTYSNIKRVATQLWSNFMQIGSKIDRDKNIYNPGPFFQKNLQFMYSKISDQNLIQKQLGMHLFCENRTNINRLPAVKAQMQGILAKHVIPELSNQAILIRAKANDMINEYGKDMTDINIIHNAVAGVYKCLTQDQSPLVRIKSAIALNPIVRHEQTKKFLHPYLKNILQVYLKIIEKYDLQQVVSALEYFINDFSQCIGPFAVDLFKYMSSIFVKMFTKDIQLSTNQQYGSQLQLAASGCLKTLTQILQSPLQTKIRNQLEPFVLQLCAFIFNSQSYDYIEDLMYLMRVHVEKIEKISPTCWFFYQVLIYFIAGIPNQLFNQIQNMQNIPQGHKKILTSVKQGDNVQFLQHVVPVIRNYFGKGMQMIIIQKQQFKINFLHMIFYLIGYVYKKMGSLQGEIHFDCCTILLVYLMESFPTQLTKQVLQNVWNLAKFNIGKAKSKYLHQITAQLIGVLLWKHGGDFLTIVVKQNKLQDVISYFIKHSSKLDQYQQRKRVILGICTLLVLCIGNSINLQMKGLQLFPLLVKNLMKNCRSRVILNSDDATTKKKLLNQQQEQQDSIDEQSEQEDDEDLWDQQYNERHVSILRQTNQIQYFRQTIQKIITQYNVFYVQLVKLVSQQKLQKLDSLITAANNLAQK